MCVMLVTLMMFNPDLKGNMRWMFNAVNLKLARGIIEAAEAASSPVIVGTAEVAFPLWFVGRGFIHSIILFLWQKDSVKNYLFLL